MKVPFKIFPSIGYKNTQFQVVCNTENLELTIIRGSEEKRTLTLSSDNPASITKLSKPGKYKAICEFEGSTYKESFVIRDAYRLGTSKFKTAYIFDDINISFFLMKDRLLIYNEKKDHLLTENEFSPTEIRKITSYQFLFITRIGNHAKGITDYGIYNIDEFKIKGELLNHFQEIFTSENSNRLWVRDKRKNEIICFQIVNASSSNFTELKRIDNVLHYEINEAETHIFIDTGNQIALVNLCTLNEKVLKKSSSGAIDKNGFFFQLDKDYIRCSNSTINYKTQFPVNKHNIHLENNDFLHLGDYFQRGTNEVDFSEEVKKISNNEIPSIEYSKKHHYYKLPKDDIIERTFSTHRVYPTVDGIFLLTQKNKVKLQGVRFRKNDADNWQDSQHTNSSTTYKIEFINGNISKTVVNTTSSLKVLDYKSFTLIVRSEDKHLILYGLNTKQLGKDSTLSIYNFAETGSNYILEQSGDLYSLYNITEWESPILNKVKVHNAKYLQEHSTIWYSKPTKLKTRSSGSLKGYSLLNGVHVKLHQSRPHLFKNKDAAAYNYKKDFIEKSDKTLINPHNAKIKDTILGDAIAVSKNLNKVITHRENIFYLQIFDSTTHKFDVKEVQIREDGYKESYLSPDGKYLVLCDKSDEYLWYDIKKQEIIKFLSGTFLSFSNEGNLIIEEDETRSVKIIDPLTFNDITPKNYHHYRFLSPDGKLYSQVSKMVRYFDRIQDKYVEVHYVNELRSQLDEPPNIFYADENKREVYERRKNEVFKNQKKYYAKHEQRLSELDIESWEKINSHKIIRIEKYTEIGIVGTDKTIEILFPDDLSYFNYAAFSYDNEYFGYVGKPSSCGLIHLFKLDFDEENNTLNIVDDYRSRYPGYAAWVCGFSKTGFFATYDSTPNTYIIKCTDQLFESKPSKNDLQENFEQNEKSLYHTFNTWNEIPEKNFLSFSSTGNYLALSEQGYEPLTLGGYGHQESNAVHIAQTDTGKIIDSFLDHGDIIKENEKKKVTFVAFSEDESKIMTMSEDGVVIIRNIDLKKNDNNKTKVVNQSYINR